MSGYIPALVYSILEDPNLGRLHVAKLFHEFVFG